MPSLLATVDYLAVGSTALPLPGTKPKRNIFTELLEASSMSVSDPLYIGGRNDLHVRRDIVAQEILKSYPSDTEITHERYEEDSVFGECLIWIYPAFDISAWAGNTIAFFLDRCGIPGELANLNVVSYTTRRPNKDGIHSGFITMNDLSEAVPIGENGWELPSGIEIRLF